jgi:hypothetical protein
MTEEQEQEVKAELVPETPKKRARKASKPGKTSVEAPEEALSQLQIWEQAGRERLQILAEFVIEDQESMDLVGELQREAFDQRKEIETLRKHLKEPALEAGRRIDNLCKPVAEFWQKIEDVCKRLQADARAVIRAAELAALKAIEDSGGQGDKDTLFVAHGGQRLELPETSREEVDYEIRIVDISLIPEAYWTKVVNTALIQAQADAYKGKIEIPGVVITEVVKIKNKAVR